MKGSLDLDHPKESLWTTQFKVALAGSLPFSFSEVYQPTYILQGKDEDLWCSSSKFSHAVYYIQNNLVRNKGLQNGILYHPFSTSSKTQVHSINLIATTWEVHNIDLRFTDPSSSEWLPTYSGWLETCACYGEAVPTSRTLGKSCLFHYFRSSAWRGTSKKEPGTKIIPKK